MAGGGHRGGDPLAGVGLRDGLALLYGYLHDWLAEYATLAALGVKEENMPEAVFSRMAETVGQTSAPSPPAAGPVRADQIAAFVAAAGE